MIQNAVTLDFEALVNVPFVRAVWPGGAFGQAEVRSVLASLDAPEDALAGQFRNIIPPVINAPRAIHYAQAYCTERVAFILFYMLENTAFAIPNARRSLGNGLSWKNGSENMKLMLKEQTEMSIESKWAATAR